VAVAVGKGLKDGIGVKVGRLTVAMGVMRVGVGVWLLVGVGVKGRRITRVVPT